jgi:hypothetical protein
MLTQSQIKAATRRARSNLLKVFTTRRNVHMLGWCAAFVQFGRVHVVQRAAP